MLTKLFQEFVTLFVVVNPIGTVPLLIAITAQESAARRRQIVGQGVLVAVLMLLFFIAIGQPLLEVLGIELSSFQIAGGLVLLIIALRMVLEEPRKMSIETTSLRNVAIFPLAMPFLAGPAAMMAVILLTDNKVYSVWEQVVTALVLLVVMAVTYACLVSAELVQRLLGATGANVVSRIMGLILAALAVQSMIGGLRQFRFS